VFRILSGQAEGLDAEELASACSALILRSMRGMRSNSIWVLDKWHGLSTEFLASEGVSFHH
jgi:hypothetical protein